jgi:hypothetical protein
MQLRKGFTLFMWLILGLSGVYAQQLAIYGNGAQIPSDGSNIPALSNGTDFGSLKIGEEATNTFTLTSLEAERPDIRIVSILEDSPHFSIDARRRIRLGPGRSRDFDIIYNPQSGGQHQATIRITARRSGELITYLLNVRGRSSINIMISQSLENGGSDMLEVTNLSDVQISDGEYYIGIFNRSRDLRRRPSEIVSVGALEAGETSLLGPGEFFDGDEVVVLSTSSRNRCYEDRVDELGSHGQDWGSERSLVKGACSSETANLEFQAEQWTVLTASEVNGANPGQNIALGRYDPLPLMWDGTTWSNSGYPDKTRKVILNGDYDGDLGDLEVCHLEVNANLNFDHGTRNSVVLHGGLKVSGDFVLGDQESLVMYDSEAQITGEVSKIERSTFRNDKYDMTYWSSSMKDATINQVFSGVKSNRIYYFDQSQTQSTDPNDTDYWNSWIVASGSITPGLGYVAEGITGTTGVHEIRFTGAPNNGNIDVVVNHWDDGNPDNDWNLLGNPYPSAIDIEKFFDVNIGLLEPVVYLWTHSTPLSDGGDYAYDDYATYNYTGGTGIGNGFGTRVGEGPVPTKNIGSAQGFFIRAFNSGSATFTNDMRLVGENDQFFKGQKQKKKPESNDEKDRIWLNLTNDQGGFNQLLIGFLDQAGPDFDPGYDARRFEGGNPISFYSRIGEEKLVIQARESFAGNISIPLGFNTYVAPRVFSIEIAKKEGVLRNEKILLRDKKLAVLHDLSSGPYEFKVESKGDQPDRFQLEFQEEADFVPEEVIEDNQWIVYARDQRCFVQASEKVKQIRIYNLLGALVHQSYPNKNQFDIPLRGAEEGEILLIDVFHENGSKRSKKIYNASPQR